MRVKAIFIFLIVVGSVVGLSIWQVDTALFHDQAVQGEAMARAQLASLVPAAGAEFKVVAGQIKALSSRSVGGAAQVGASGTSADATGVPKKGDFNDTIAPDIELMAEMSPTETGEFNLQNKFFREGTPVRSWAESYTTIALRAVKPSEVAESSVALVALQDPQRNTFFLWIQHHEGNHWEAFITKPSIFQALMDRQKGQLSSLMLVNQQGQVLGHTTSEYVGTNLKDDGFVAEMMKAGKRVSSGLFKEKNGEPYQGFYEQVPGTNFFVLWKRPLAAFEKERENLKWQLILLGGGLCFVGVAGLLLMTRSGAKSDKGAAVAGSASAMDVDSPPAAKKAGEGGGDPTQERTKALKAAASALARELNGPLSRILALGGLLKGKSLSPEQSKDAQEIEDLARSGRLILNKLLTFAGEQEYRAEPTSVNECLTQVLASLEGKFQSKGIKVEKHLKRVPEVAGHSVGLMKALEALLGNSIEAMERMPNKLIRIDLEEIKAGASSVGGTAQVGASGTSADATGVTSAGGGWVVLKIKDSGEGIESGVVSRVFDPFFTTKSNALHSGLGLSMAAGVVRQFGGDIKLQSQPREGTVVEVRWPVLNAPGMVGAKAMSAVAKAPPTAATAPSSVAKTASTPAVKIDFVRSPGSPAASPAASPAGGPVGSGSGIPAGS
ncbi:MAG: hypothetical protein C5B49_10780, partial [Bdellovibrio sp.]